MSCSAQRKQLEKPYGDKMVAASGVSLHQKLRLNQLKLTHRHSLLVTAFGTMCSTNERYRNGQR
uniref:Uncharacterized protein n=1 Tax=Manihot esculenta TaxID=3983 RepID=A0A2C9UM59_MANES